MRRGKLAAKAAVALALALAAMAATGCGGKLPEISTLEWRLESRPGDAGSGYESLSVFASIRDEDGLDNISEIWIVNDDSALAWKLTDSDWVKVVEGGDTWFGGSALAAPELASMPRGSYRLIAIDAAGQRTENEFKVSGNFPSQNSLSVNYSGGLLSIVSTWPEALALAFDGTGALISSPGITAKPSTLAESFGPDIADRTAEVGAYGFDPALRMGSFSKRIKTR